MVAQFGTILLFIVLFIALIGQRAMVKETLSAHQPGQVSLRGEVWRACPAADEPGPLGPGTEVMVEGVDGVTLTVRRIK